MPFSSAYLMSRALSRRSEMTRGVPSTTNSLTDWFALYSYRKMTLSKLCPISRAIAR